MKKNTNDTKREKIKTPFSTTTFSVSYPEKNPENSLKDITKALGYIGVFDNMET